MINTLVDNGTIKLGYVSDNDATIIQFPIANIYALLGNGGEFYLLNKRPLDEIAYAVPPSQITTDDAFLYWTVAAYDVAQYGNGECQLQYRIGSVIKMTQKWRTAVCASLVDGGTVPTPYETWLDDLADIADRCEDAEAHYPQIGTNGNWYVWDVNAGAFVDTGFPSGGGTTYHTITETEDGGEYVVLINATSGDAFAVDILSNGGAGITTLGGDITLDAPSGNAVNVTNDMKVGGRLLVSGQEVDTKKTYTQVLNITADGTETSYTLAGPYKKFAAFMQLPSHSLTILLQCEMDGNLIGYVTSQTSIARDGYVRMDCTEGLLMSDFLPNASVNSTASPFSYPARMVPTSDITNIVFKINTGIAIPSGTIIRAYAIS